MAGAAAVLPTKAMSDERPGSSQPMVSVIMPAFNSAAYIDDTFGVLKLRLEEGRYEWRFVAVEEGSTSADSGSAKCH